MAIDASIPLQINTNPVGMLSSVLGVRNQQQQLQAGQMANQQAAIDLQERQGAQGVLKNIKDYQDSAGNVDMNRLTPAIMSVAPTTGSDVLSRVAQAQAAATGARTAVVGLDKATRQVVGNALYSLKDQPPEVVASTMDGLKKAYPSLAPAVDFLDNYIVGPSASDPKQLNAHLDAAGKFVQEAGTQQSMSTPEGVTVNNGQTTKVVSTKPGTAVPAGQVVPGTEATLRPGPTTATVDQAGTQGIMGAPQADFSGVQGPQRSAILADIAAREPGSDVAREANNVMTGRPQGFIPQSLPAGQVQNISNNVDEMNRHFGGLQDQSSGAQLVTGLTGNIKALADQAATGTGGGRKAFVDGLLSAMHVPGTGDLQKDTDLLEKNMAQLNLGTPASSDAARTLVAAARPHSSMSAGAIKEAADQVASQVQANMAIRNMLAPAKMMGDPATYQAQRQKLEQIVDPRAWQYVNLGPGSQAAKDFMARLQPSDRAALIQKVDQLEQMGMLK